MSVERWLDGARRDVEARGLPEVAPLLESLAAALQQLRRADWNLPADAPLPAALAASDDGSESSPGPVHPLPATAPATRGPRAPGDGPLATRPIRELAALLRDRTITSEGLLRECFDAIDRRDAGINAFITTLHTAALAQARAADHLLSQGGAHHLLCGIPISLKDLIDLAGVPTTAASRVRAGVIASTDATVVARLRGAGAVFVGKCNLHEFAFGTTNEDSAFGAVKHPLDPERSPGGSSGGSAAGVLAGMSVASIGTDTGGSIRIPAAACGLVGLKPTLGGVPTDGVVPLGTSLDHVGPIARTVDDASILFDALRGYPHVTDTPIGQDVSPAAIRVGIPRAYFLDLLEDGVRAAFDHAVRTLEAAGVVVEEVALPHARLTGPVYLATVLAEAAQYHAPTLEARPGDYTPAVRVRLEMSRYVPAEDYLRAQKGRSVLRAEVDAALSGRQALLLPTLPIVAPRLGVPTVNLGGSTESVRNVTLRLTQLFDLTGHPAISLPCGRGDAGLPVGAQLVGHLRQTRELLRVAGACERLWGDV